jgi:hypothetical protein
MHIWLVLAHLLLALLVADALLLSLSLSLRGVTWSTRDVEKYCGLEATPEPVVIPHGYSSAANVAGGCDEGSNGGQSARVKTQSSFVNRVGIGKWVWSVRESFGVDS